MRSRLRGAWCWENRHKQDKTCTDVCTFVFHWPPLSIFECHHIARGSAWVWKAQRQARDRATPPNRPAAFVLARSIDLLCELSYCRERLRSSSAPPLSGRDSAIPLSSSLEGCGSTFGAAQLRRFAPRVNQIWIHSFQKWIHGLQGLFVVGVVFVLSPRRDRRSHDPPSAPW